jgi:hypothetical protein
MVHVINYVRARGHVFFSERSERRIWEPKIALARTSDYTQITQLCRSKFGWQVR